MKAHPKVHSNATRLARRALDAAIAEDTDTVSDILMELAVTCGAIGICIAIIRWCDALVEHATDGKFNPTSGVRVQFNAVDMRSGAMTDPLRADAAIPFKVKWAGAVLDACASRQMRTFQNLLHQLPPDDDEASECIEQVLVSVAMTIKGLPRGIAVLGHAELDAMDAMDAANGDT